MHGLELTGVASGVRIEGGAVLHGGAALRAATVRGDRGVDAADGTPSLESVLLDLSAGPGLRVGCDTTLQARHVTLLGRPDAAVTTLCASSTARVRDSILWGPPGTGFTGPGAVVTDRSDYRAVAGHAPGAGDREVEPGFARGSARLAAARSGPPREAVRRRPRAHREDDVANVSLAPGRVRRVRIGLTRPAHRAVRERRRIRMVLHTAVRDRQGLTRTSAVPVVVERRFARSR